FEEFMSSIKGRTFFAYLIIDELYTFYKKKSQKAYVWSAIAVDIEGNQHYFYHLSEKKDNKALLEFKEKLPNVEIVFCDENVSYNSVFGDKATMKKSVFTNLVESLNSSLRSKISYLTRKSDKHAKSFEWLDFRLSHLFHNKNFY
ncbi:transposase, IS1 family, partial [Thiovulum sp. ES]